MLHQPYQPTILVVDDDPPILELVGEALRDEGFRVVLAATLKAATGALARTRFDLVLADPVGAFTPGFAAGQWRSLEQLRAHAGDTPIVIFTAHGRNQFADYALRGFCDLVTKPFDLDCLAATLRRHIAASHTEHTPVEPLSVSL